MNFSLDPTYADGWLHLQEMMFVTWPATFETQARFGPLRCSIIPRMLPFGFPFLIYNEGTDFARGQGKVRWKPHFYYLWIQSRWPEW